MIRAIIPARLLDAIEIEGSALEIRKASSFNLDWTWRVVYCNGETGGEIRRTGPDLQAVLDEVAKVSPSRTQESQEPDKPKDPKTIKEMAIEHVNDVLSLSGFLDEHGVLCAEMNTPMASPYPRNKLISDLLDWKNKAVLDALLERGVQ